MIELFAILVLLVVLTAVYAWRLARERVQLRALVAEGPLAWAGCHAPSGADVVLCGWCAFKADWAPGRGPTPLYRDEIEEWWGLEFPVCHKCHRSLLPRLEGRRTRRGEGV